MRPFETYHPAVPFAFFMGAVILAIIVQRPLFQAAGFAAATLLYVSMRGRQVVGFLGVLAIVFVVIAALNPLFNTRGETVLFYVLQRPYTLESLAYGLSTAAMFTTIVLWFASYSRIVTSDKFTYLFGGVAPALTLLLSMVLRLIPAYRRKAHEISTARACIGKSASAGSVRRRITGAAAVLSTLTSWSFEGSIVTADSMRARGYGTGQRSSYARYRVRVRDVVLGVLLIVAFVGTCILVALGTAPVTYLPAISIPPLSAWGYLALACFCVYAFAPVATASWEVIAWRLSVSRT